MQEMKIGANVIILKGVYIGNGAVVAAGAIVTKNIEEREVVAGIPARYIKKRKESFDYIISYRRLFQ